MFFLQYYFQITLGATSTVCGAETFNVNIINSITFTQSKSAGDWVSGRNDIIHHILTSWKEKLNNKLSQEGLVFHTCVFITKQVETAMS